DGRPHSHPTLLVRHDSTTSRPSDHLRLFAARLGTFDLRLSTCDFRLRTFDLVANRARLPPAPRSHSPSPKGVERCPDDSYASDRRSSSLSPRSSGSARPS